MNISMSNMNTSISQLSQMNSGYKNNALSKSFQNQERSGGDEVKISSEGRAMSKMMRAQEGQDKREAQQAAFTETYESLNIESLDTENMTDEEISEVLASFEESMSEYMHDGFKPSSEMDSSELKEAINNVKEMATNMNETKGQYGPPKGGGPPKGTGPRKGGGTKGVQSAEATEVTETETDEDDLIATLLEALEEDAEDEENVYYNSETASEENFMMPKSMTEILSMMSQTSSNI